MRRVQAPVRRSRQNAQPRLYNCMVRNTASDMNEVYSRFAGGMARREIDYSGLYTQDLYASVATAVVPVFNLLCFIGHVGYRALIHHS